ncbi:hypothetical protein [Paenibacillus polymyxa]|uniref:hypothetical protein n=1 Tax=Paenibacillus polymyxa TaxID=1406 RepID=UPI00049620FF|nr:hypothetical protein [Paenibacillus polymyxa]
MSIVNVVAVQTRKVPYHPDLTLEQLCYFLDISPKATNLITSMKFMLNTTERLNEFLERSSFSKHPLSLLVKMRKEHIDTYSYTNKSDFTYDYYLDKQAALEKLFQEPMEPFKLNRFKTDDPELIYDTYISRGKYSTAGEIALFIYFLSPSNLSHNTIDLLPKTW